MTDGRFFLLLWLSIGVGVLGLAVLALAWRRVEEPDDPYAEVTWA